MKRRIEPPPGMAPIYVMSNNCVYTGEPLPDDMPDALPKCIDGVWFWIDDQPEPKVVSDEQPGGGAE